MATLYVKTPNGTQYSIDLTKINSGGGSAATNGYALMNNGCMLQWGASSAGWTTFPVGFTTVYGVVATCSNSNWVWYSDLSTTQFQFRASGGGTYIALGK